MAEKPRRGFLLYDKLISALIVAGFAARVCAIGLPAPGADGKIVLDVADGQYAATDSVTCTQVVFSANNISVDLSADGGKTIAIPSTVTTDGFTFSARYYTASVLGGIWDFGGNASMTVGKDTHEHAIEFNGTKVHNVNGVIIGNNRRDCTLTLTNGAELDADSLRITQGSTGGRSKFEILGGSTASFTANFVPEEGVIGGLGGNQLIIDGVGSSLSVPNKPVQLGRGRSSDRMVISNKGSASLQNLAIGGYFTKNGVTQYSTNTVLVVDDATLTTTDYFAIGSSSCGSTGLVSKATLSIGGDATVGNNATAVDNLLFVSGSVMTVNGPLSIGNDGSSGNRAEFRDTTLSANSLRVGLGEGSTNNTLVLAGTTTWTQKKAHSDDAYYPFFFGAAGRNEVILTDGFQFTPGGGSEFSVSSNNTLRICNGAKVTKTGLFFFGLKDSKCHDNTYSVEAGGTSVLYRVNLGGFRNRIVVSNGVFQSTRDNITALDALRLGIETNSVANPSVGCELVLRGTKPQFISEKGGMKVYGDGKGILRFELPDAELETLPVYCGMIEVDEGAAIHVTCDNYLSYLGTGRGRLVLARASTAERLSIPQSVLAAANAELPERCELVVDGTDLVLKVRGNKGIVVSFR